MKRATIVDNERSWNLEDLILLLFLYLRKIDAIHEFAREGEVENLLKSIESGIPVNAKG